MGECGVGREGLEKLLVTSLLWEGFNPLEVLSRVSPKVLGAGWGARGVLTPHPMTATFKDHDAQTLPFSLLLEFC